MQRVHFELIGSSFADDPFVKEARLVKKSSASKKSMPVINRKHCNLDQEQQKEFKRIVQRSEQNAPAFGFMSRNKTTMILWVMLVMTFGIFSIYLCYDHVNLPSLVAAILLIASGMVALQLLFVSSHTASHAMFLEYENIKLDNERWSEQHPIFYYAFYHHHHSFKNNWFPELSYHNPKGTINVVAAHWDGYSLLAKKERIMIVLFFMLLNPICGLFFFGYELGALLLPYAHLWQHISHSRMAVFEYILRICEKCGLIANGADHHRHHNHNHDTVYQDFSSSGIYMKHIDDWINYLWDCAFKTAKETEHNRPYDVMQPYCWWINRAVIGSLPAFVVVLGWL
ncbi:hypothetical protein AKO1_006703 [Acrasis kona]|uniref:Fatty acid desaturase domain-containing protein n=1 Tax=Acrasis kona TaxID=1008807 RepID=A0AAW2ZL10_9EUKA